MPWSASEFFGRLAEAKRSDPVPSGEPYFSILGPTEATGSSWVKEFSYIQTNTSSGMLIVFLDGAKCFYPDTPIRFYYSMERAPSRGRWVHDNVYHTPYELL